MEKKNKVPVFTVVCCLYQTTNNWTLYVKRPCCINTRRSREPVNIMCFQARCLLSNTLCHLTAVLELEELKLFFPPQRNVETHYVTSNLMPLCCCLTSNPSQGTHRRNATCHHIPEHPRGRRPEIRGRWDRRALAQIVRSWQLRNRCRHDGEPTFKRRVNEEGNKKKWKKEGGGIKNDNRTRQKWCNVGTRPEESQGLFTLAGVW